MHHVRAGQHPQTALAYVGDAHGGSGLRVHTTPAQRGALLEGVHVTTGLPLGQSLREVCGGGHSAGTVLVQLQWSCEDGKVVHC